MVIDAPLVNNRASTPSYNYHKASPVLFLFALQYGYGKELPASIEAYRAPLVALQVFLLDAVWSVPTNGCRPAVLLSSTT